MKERRVVIVAYPGLQPLDVVGPYEVFVGATRVLAATGQSGGYQVTLASEMCIRDSSSTCLSVRNIDSVLLQEFGQRPAWPRERSRCTRSEYPGHTRYIVILKKVGVF